MTIIGNCMNFNVHKSPRERVRSFYLDVFNARRSPAPLLTWTCGGGVQGEEVAA